MRCLPLGRARLGAGCTTLLAALVACVLAPPGAAAHHGSGWNWNWQADTEDQASWSGAGAGWNGGATTTATTTTTAPTATWTPQDAREVDVRDLRIDRAAISPNGDGEGDEVFVSLRLRRDSAPVSVQVVDAVGTAVRSLGEQRSTRVYGRFGWDGTTDAGVVVPDGAYRIVLAKATTTTSTRADDADPMSIDVLVDTASPAIEARRPTLVQLRALAKRAGDLRDARRRWASRWNRHPHGGPPGHQRHRQQRWSELEGEWVRLFESRQLRLPVTFTTIEDGNVTITTRVDGRSTELATWRSAGRHTLDVVLPTYVSGAQLSITFETSDDAGNARRHTIVALLAAMPAPRPIRRTTGDGDRPDGAAPVTGVPTSTGGPLPDWLDPIMLRATYAAGVPQSWAKSQALANIVYRESSYRPTAQNPTSTAYGLFQFLDQTWATVGCRKTSDAYQQSVCGLRYIQRRYHTPEAAWRFWQANHWY